MKRLLLESMKQKVRVKVYSRVKDGVIDEVRGIIVDIDEMGITIEVSVSDLVPSEEKYVAIPYDRISKVFSNAELKVENDKSE